MAPKPVHFLGDSLKRLRAFPEIARRDAGHPLDRLQHGLQPYDSKPMPTIGPGVEEIRVRDPSGAFRVICLARRRDSIYVLHAFQKKTQRTALLDIELARQRLANLKDGKA